MNPRGFEILGRHKKLYTLGPKDVYSKERKLPKIAKKITKNHVQPVFDRNTTTIINLKFYIRKLWTICYILYNLHFYPGMSSSRKIHFKKVVFSSKNRPLGVNEKKII